MSEPRRQQHRILVSKALPRGFHVLGTEEVVIGRSEGVQIELLADEVSKRHARITWEPAGNVHVVHDLASANGTFVSGTRIAGPKKLANDDVIAIGPFQLHYLLVEGTHDDLLARYDSRGSDTVRKESASGARPTSLLRAAAGGAGKVGGPFTDPAALYVAVRTIESERRSGELRVEASGLVGKIRFRDGLIVDAKLGIETGEKAARRILGFQRGEFSFDPTREGAPAPSGQFALKPQDLLRGGSKPPPPRPAGT